VIGFIVNMGPKPPRGGPLDQVPRCLDRNSKAVTVRPEHLRQSNQATPAPGDCASR